MLFFSFISTIILCILTEGNKLLIGTRDDEEGEEVGQLIKLALMIIAAMVAITLHEYPKAVAAVFLGDNTPRLQGKLTLNPFKHMDPIGFILLVTYSTGWSYPVNFNANNFKNRKQGTYIVSLIGIVVSFSVGVALLVLNKFLVNNPLTLVGYSFYFKWFIEYLMIYSLGIALFNLIPVPPLSISKVVEVSQPRFYFKLLEKEGMIHLGVLMLYFIGIIPKFITSIINIVITVFF